MGNKLKDFFIKEVEPERPEITDYDYPDDEDIQEESIEVDTSGVTENNLIGDIYESNGLTNLSKTVFKVEELINSLPKEMPDTTKRDSVLQILNSFGISVDEIESDANNRISIIKASVNKIVSDCNYAIDSNSEAIEQKKVEIQNLEKDNSDLSSIIKNNNEKSTIEIDRIEKLIDFIKGNNICH